MALVHLRNNSIWYASRWILRELLDLMTDELLPEQDGEALYKLVQAEAFSALQLHLYEPAVAERIEKTLLRVAHAVVDGRISVPLSSALHNKQSRDMFVDAVRELLKMMMVPVDGGGGAS